MLFLHSAIAVLLGLCSLAAAVPVAVAQGQALEPNQNQLEARAFTIRGKPAANGWTHNDVVGSEGKLFKDTYFKVDNQLRKFKAGSPAPQGSNFIFKYIEEAKENISKIKLGNKFRKMNANIPKVSAPGSP